MKPLHRGLLLAALHCAMVLSLAGKYAYDRERLPRVWAKTAPVDPNLPVRGRYASLRVEVEPAAALQDGLQFCRLAVRESHLMAIPDDAGSGQQVMRTRSGTAVLREPVAFFLPEHAADPTRLQTGEELWVEVSVPSAGPPRPLRLAVKKEGQLKPLILR